MTEFQRIFSPRLAKALKSISLLANGSRYSPTELEINDTLGALKDAVNDIAEAYGVLGVVEKEAPDEGSRVEASRLDEKIETNRRAAFSRQDVHMNVHSIPEAQVTAYATHIVARLCGKFEEAEAQPKNYEPKEKE